MSRPSRRNRIFRPRSRLGIRYREHTQRRPRCRASLRSLLWLYYGQRFRGEPGPMKRLPFELTVSRDVYEAVGHMLCQWAHFEQAVNEWLFELSGAVTDYAQLRIGQQQFKTRLGKWQELVAPHIKQRLARGYLTKFYIKGAKLKDDRDGIAHGHLGIDGEGQLIRFRHKY